MLVRTEHFVSNGAGWELLARHCYDDQLLKPDLRPIAIVPGYGMNSFIFGWHPTGLSMEEYFTREGFEVWSLTMRGQSGTRRNGGTHDYGIADAALTDLGAMLDYIVENTKTTATKVDLIGCSLGGTYVYTHIAMRPSNRAGSVISIGGPLRWEAVHPALKIAFASPWLAGQVRFAGTRQLARYALPFLVKVPPIFNLYMHSELVDTSDPATLTKVVEDPNRFLNREIAEWVKTKDLLINGVNVSDALRTVKNPLLCVLANADGIVPPPTALSVLDYIGGDVKDVIVVGNDRLRFAHADLFISYLSQRMVFEPMAAWLKKQE